MVEEQLSAALAGVTSWHRLKHSATTSLTGRNDEDLVRKAVMQDCLHLPAVRSQVGVTLTCANEGPALLFEDDARATLAARMALRWNSHRLNCKERKASF